MGFGSYDFTRQGPGLIACFSLKNPTYPEFLFKTESGVMCLDFHQEVCVHAGKHITHERIVAPFADRSWSIRRHGRCV